jgi:phosphate transport system substrate-binding protein
MKKHLSLLVLCCLAVPVHAQLRYAGSDTVEPVVDAARTAFNRSHPNFKLSISSVGSSSGLRELCTNRAFFVGASRKIKSEEAKECERAGIAPVEVPVGLDAVVMVVSSKNSFVKDLSLDDVQRIYAPQATGKLISWNAVKPAFADQPLRAMGVGIKHGTFDFFHGAIGNGKFVRSDYKDTVHHDETAKLVAADPGAIGYVPLSVAKDFATQLRIVNINFGEGPIEPTEQSIRSGKYGALSRTTYFYVNLPALVKAGGESHEFIKDLMTNLSKYVNFANMTTLSPQQYQETAKRVGFAIAP